MEKSKSYNNKILVAGFAQLPKGTPAFEVQKSIGCILIVDEDTAIIREASFTFIQDLTNEFISSLVIGYSLIEDVEKVTSKIQSKFLVPPQKAVIQSIISAKNRLQEELEG